MFVPSGPYPPSYFLSMIHAVDSWAELVCVVITGFLCWVYYSHPMTFSGVQPYTVNERLFTVPLTGNLLGEPLTTPDVEKTWLECDMPTRFVRYVVTGSSLAPFRDAQGTPEHLTWLGSCSFRKHHPGCEDLWE